MALSDRKKGPPRRPEQPIFYPVHNRAYATRRAQEPNIAEKGMGSATSLDDQKSFLNRHPLQKAGRPDSSAVAVPSRRRSSKPGKPSITRRTS